MSFSSRVDAALDADPELSVSDAIAQVARELDHPSERVSYITLPNGRVASVPAVR